MAKTVRKRRNFKSRAVKYMVVRPDGSVKLVKRAGPHSVTKLAVGRKDAKVIGRLGKGTVIEQRVFGSDGRLKTVYTIDSGSGNFGSELGYAFKKNVAKARRENKRKFGTADGVAR